MLLFFRPEKEKENLRIVSEARKELTEHIIPFLGDLRDNTNGGFFGFEDPGLISPTDNDKEIILLSGILWFFSECYLVLGDPDCLDNASHCYRFLRDHAVDPVYGGVFRLVKADGTPAVKLKDTKCGAFFIYALSVFYKASGNDQALKLALGLFETIEKELADHISYADTLTEDWRPITDKYCTECETAPRKTAETYLHLLKAYTGLYRVSFDERVLNRLRYIVGLFFGKIYDPDRHGIILSFSDDMEPVVNSRSPALDAEAARLVYRACETAGEDELKTKALEMNRAVLNELAEYSCKTSALSAASENCVIDYTRLWRCRTEIILCFLNGYELTGNVKYFDIALDIWNDIKKEAADRFSASERSVKFPGNICPDISVNGCTREWIYHYGRVCIDIIQSS